MHTCSNSARQVKLKELLANQKGLANQSDAASRLERSEGIGR